MQGPLDVLQGKSQCAVARHVDEIEEAVWHSVSHMEVELVPELVKALSKRDRIIKKRVEEARDDVDWGQLGQQLVWGDTRGAERFVAHGRVVANVGLEAKLEHARGEEWIQ
eukprot:CAMPEP_0175831236 /NCGR_PEP_ID=MMETSP0107_2-20121207/14353_1 /TAXON_ID=195067 ORGANISM="Goniomonas pacifica, Strain CCMP1869" /NCGR_SAMPLE_ID=MMETSP0107_2 /ASSEMBLY_ACC=CAM_ASM_000203 /LENGTH=110 /DNA_ID=CAMNT_0017144253 /DNA_START=132 /DNA_END=464 /DNA_ORIENTATION=+